jgi:hypothetical protein
MRAVDRSRFAPRIGHARCFEMWNTGDSSLTAKVLRPGWVDHAHPKVTGPHAVQLAVEQTQAAQSDV